MSAHWVRRAYKLTELGSYQKAGESYRQAALLGGGFNRWCDASRMFALASNQDDQLLFCAEDV